MDEHLIHIALSVSILGLLLLAFSNELLDPPVSRIDQVSANSLGKNLRVKGNISSVHEFEGGSILLTLDDGSGELDVYLPYSVAGALPNSSALDVTGSVEIYKGRLELVIEDVSGLEAIG